MSVLSENFSAGTVALPQLLQMIRQDETNGQYASLQAKLHIVIKSIGNGAELSEENRKILSDALSVLTRNEPNKALMLMTGEAASHSRKLIEPYLYEACYDDKASSPLRAKGLRILLSSRDVDHDLSLIMETALDLLQQEKNQPRMLASERAALYETVISVASKSGYNQLYEAAINSFEEDRNDLERRKRSAEPRTFSLLN